MYKRLLLEIIFTRKIFVIFNYNDRIKEVFNLIIR